MRQYCCIIGVWPERSCYGADAMGPSGTHDERRLVLPHSMLVENPIVLDGRPPRFAVPDGYRAITLHFRHGRADRITGALRDAPARALRGFARFHRHAGAAGRQALNRRASERPRVAPTCR